MLKAWFAKDRWKIVRMVRWGHGESVSYTEIMLINRYNGKARTVELDGYWSNEDFPNRTFRP